MRSFLQKTPSHGMQTNARPFRRITLGLRRGLIGLLMVLGTLLFLIPYGRAKDPDLPVVKLVVTDENLRDVLEQISKITGYEILLSGDTGDQPVSVILNDPLDEALRKILRRYSYAVVRNKEEKKVVLSIFDDSLASNSSNRKSRTENVAESSFFLGDRDSENRNSFYTPPPPLKDDLPSKYRNGYNKDDRSPSISGTGTRFIPTTPTIAD